MPNILDFLDGKNSIDRHVIVATTNNSEKLEDNLIRPSRLDLVYLVDLPSKEHREEYFKFKNVPEEDLGFLVEQSDNCSLADLKEIYICKYLLNYTIEDAILKVKSPRKKTNYLKRNGKKSRLGL
jgi:ATP-dependent 26S proteasome regulatory subunit